jgi:cyclopropane fatty-acyl-phospholipid synthase-like methyltransferase
MSYDETYGRVKGFFGNEPNEILKQYYGELDSTRPVLDIGAGQGRNALYLARKGYTVDAIDPSRVAIETIANIAEQENLPLSVSQCGFETFVPQTDFYSGILIFGIMQILKWEEIDLLVKNIETWTSAGSLVFVTAFTTADPSYERTVNNFRKIGKNSFENAEGAVHTYLEENEILTLFRNFRALYHHEGLGPEHRHGDRPPHRHHSVEAIFKKMDRGEYIV